MSAGKDKEFDVVGVGKAYTDIIARVPEAFLAQNNIPLGGSAYFDVEEMGKILRALPDSLFCPGGTISNTLSGLVSLGAKVGFFGKVAADRAGCVFLEDLQARGIPPLCELVVRTAPVSGTCVVLLNEGGERSFALHNGCVSLFEAREFDAFDFSRAKIFVVASKLLVTPESSASLVYAIRKAKAEDCKIAISLSEVWAWTGYEDVVREVVDPLADLLIGNEEESSAFFEAVGHHEEEKKRIFITTMGSRGAWACRAGQETRVEAWKGGVFVNSLGAGDLFLAGVLRGWLEDFPLGKMLSLGARCAAEVVKREEGRPVVGEDWCAFLGSFQRGDGTV